jgi:tetratricopeptide (TPR) repeat protein/DNA-binding winged helix-turn-helix (wHTH) protein
VANSVTETQIYRFENVEVNVSRGCLLRENQERHLRQKTFQVLVYLLERRERLVTKEELMQTVWKDTAVTDDVLVQCVKEIRRALSDDPHHPRFIKTVPKAGYRFISPVKEVFGGATAFVETEEITSVELEFEETSDSPEFAALLSKTLPVAAPKHWADSRIVIALILLATLALSFYLIPELRRSEQSSAAVTLSQTPGKRTLAVMFFENQSRSAELDWLREGLADMLITNLSHSEKLTVLSRQQLHVLLERAGHKTGDEINLEKALEVARKSGAEVFVIGSFARLGEKVRLDVRLHDTQTGRLEVAESLTVEKPEQILTEIDLLSFKLANRFGASEQEKNRANLAAAMTNNLEAYRYYSLALEKAQGLHKKDAIELLEKAVALDPEFAMAHARIGHTYAVTWGWAEEAKPHLERAFALSERLTEKDRLYIAAWYAIANLDYPAALPPFREIIAKYPTETEAYLRLGYLLRGEEQFDEAINVMRQGLAIDPESSALYNALGLLYSLLGRHDEAISMHERYAALAPHEANARDSLGMSYQWAGRYEEAINEYKRSLELNRNFEIAHAHLGTAYFQSGRYRTAIDWFKKYIAIAPSKLESARGYSHIAYVYRKQKNLAAAEQAAKQAIKENDIYSAEMFFIAAERGDRATARKFEERLFAQSGFSNRGSRNTPRYLSYYRGFIEFQNGRTNDALMNFQAALRHPPATWDIDALEDCLANAYLQLGRFDEAVAEYERILRLNPNYPLARFHLAQAYERKGLQTEARENYARFLQIWENADADIPEVIAAKIFFTQQ